MIKELLKEMSDEDLMELERLLTRTENALKQKKPMTEREIMEQARVDEFNAIDTAVFAIGVRWAERMHGIGEEDVRETPGD